MKHKGLVVRSTGSWYEVRTTIGEILPCRLKGKFKIKGLQTSNPIAVGDRVSYEFENDHEQQGMITNIEPRQNYLIRSSVHKAKQAHILAANIDQALLIITLTYPRTSLGFIDRFLVSAEAYNITTILVFNKIDLFDAEMQGYQQEIIDQYKAIGYDSLQTSATEGLGIAEFRNVLSEKITLVSGHSGVGKSTLINAIAPDLNLRTSEISTFAEKGIHTTTFAEMFELAPDTFLIDTPGIKELGLIDIERAELSHFFPEMRALIGQCKFHNCLHDQEPSCAVIQAVEAEKIPLSRYRSYLSMLYGEDNRK